MALTEAENQYLIDVGNPHITEESWSVKSMLITELQILKNLNQYIIISFPSFSPPFYPSHATSLLTLKFRTSSLTIFIIYTDK